MNIILRIKEVVRQYVEPHRRFPVRLGWMWSLTAPLQELWDSFEAWRTYYRYKIHVTSQHKSLSGHLEKLFGAQVVVQTRGNMYLPLGLEQERAHWAILDPAVPIALDGEEDALFGDADFLIFTPPGTDIDLLVAEVERLILADKTYKIIIR